MSLSWGSAGGGVVVCVWWGGGGGSIHSDIHTHAAKDFSQEAKPGASHDPDAQSWVRGTCLHTPNPHATVDHHARAHHTPHPTTTNTGTKERQPPVPKLSSPTLRSNSKAHLSPSTPALHQPQPHHAAMATAAAHLQGHDHEGGSHFIVIGAGPIGLLTAILLVQEQNAAKVSLEMGPPHSTHPLDHDGPRKARRPPPVHSRHTHNTNR